MSSQLSSHISSSREKCGTQLPSRADKVIFWPSGLCKWPRLDRYDRPRRVHEYTGESGPSWLCMGTRWGQNDTRVRSHGHREVFSWQFHDKNTRLDPYSKAFLLRDDILVGAISQPELGMGDTFCNRGTDRDVPLCKFWYRVVYMHTPCVLDPSRGKLGHIDGCRREVRHRRLDIHLPARTVGTPLRDLFVSRWNEFDILWLNLARFQNGHRIFQTLLTMFHSCRRGVSCCQWWRDRVWKVEGDNLTIIKAFNCILRISLNPPGSGKCNTDSVFNTQKANFTLVITSDQRK